MNQATPPEVNENLQAHKDSLITEATGLARLVEVAAWNAKYGTFSARNPTLGRMVSCPYCGQRKRSAVTVPCCLPTNLIAQGFSPFVAGSENSKVRPSVKRKNPRLARNRPPLFEVQQILAEREKQGLPEYEGLSGVIEAGIKRKRLARIKAKKRMQRESRKRNRK